MPATPNARVIFSSYLGGPSQSLVYESDSTTIDLDNVPLNGGILIKNLYLAVEPYMLAQMGEVPIPGVPPFTIGQPSNGYAVGVVLRSETTSIKAGDHVYGVLDHQSYVVRETFDDLRVVDNKDNTIPWSAFLGVAGLPGKVAWMGWQEHSQAKKGETVYVSAGGGPVGSAVIQIAKLAGLKVIGSAGSDDKVEFMKSIGADVAFNYKTTNANEVLAKEGPIDIYWDNVGAETLDAALGAANLNARFIECGMMAVFASRGSGKVVDYKNIFNIISQSISLHGFVISRIQPKWEDEFYATIPNLVSKGDLKFQEEVWEGLEGVEKAVMAHATNTTKAKAVVKLADA